MQQALFARPILIIKWATHAPYFQSVTSISEIERYEMTNIIKVKYILNEQIAIGFLYTDYNALLIEDPTGLKVIDADGIEIRKEEKVTDTWLHEIEPVVKTIISQTKVLQNRQKQFHDLAIATTSASDKLSSQAKRLNLSEVPLIKAMANILSAFANHSDKALCEELLKWDYRYGMNCMSSAWIMIVIENYCTLRGGLSDQKIMFTVGDIMKECSDEVASLIREIVGENELLTPIFVIEEKSAGPILSWTDNASLSREECSKNSYVGKENLLEKLSLVVTKTLSEGDIIFADSYLQATEIKRL